MIEDLANKVYNKLHNEYFKYIENIKKLPSEEIIKNSYPITIRQEFVDMFYGTGNFDKFQLLALLEKENTLDYLYDAYENTDGGLHNLLEEKLDEEFYDLGNDYESKIKEKIDSDKNSKLIKSISEVLKELNRYNFCNYIQQEFNVDDLDAFDVYNILNAKDGAKYLYNFCDQVRHEKQLLYLKEIMVTNSEVIDNIDDKILPKLKEFIEAKEKETIEKPKDKGREER